MSNSHPPTFYLASHSPQRIRLLKEAGYAFALAHHHAKEPPPQPGENPCSYAIRMATLKASNAAKSLPPNAFVLAADTVVSCNNKILGKPKNQEEAFEMLRFLRGQTQKVITGLCLYQTPNYLLCQKSVVSQVKMSPLSDKEIKQYLAHTPSIDRAGACDIEDQNFVQLITGSYSNVIGLPLEEFSHLYQLYIAPKHQPIQ
ncbi:MAG: septum formation protein Maf [Planctomycetota bacterium]|nr:MAG: septum formation protein Maf [Planctomycetota bacterium]